MKNYDYRNPSLLTSCTLFLFTLFILLKVVGLWFGYEEYQLLNSIQGGADISDSTWDENKLKQVIMNFIQIGSYLIGLISFWIWLNRYSKNTHAIKSYDLDVSPGWAVGYFFIPIINIFKPFKVIKELWDTNVEVGGSIVGLWWGLWISTFLLGQMAIKIDFAAEDTRTYLIANHTTRVSDIANMLLAIVMIAMIYKMAKAQQKLFKDLLIQTQKDTGDPVECLQLG